MVAKKLELRERFLSEAERTALLGEIEGHASLFRRIGGAAGFGPRYSVIDGGAISASLPAVKAIGQRLAPLVAEFAGHEVRPLSDAIRWGRVQRYDAPCEGFRWHFDGHDFAALVTLENGAGGGTELIGPGLSRLATPFLYALYAFHRVFSILPRDEVRGGPGDLLIIRGRELLHRGHQRGPGRRTILVFAFDTPGREISPIRAWLARFVNY